jgi:hypothetical protein
MRRLAVLLVLTAGVATAERPSPLRVEPDRLAAAPPGLKAQLREDAFAYFRFVNSAWAARVCEAYRTDLPSLPAAILHGDAHFGQYALTATARGLDDFDDAARGPSVIDLVRFLGSVDLVARQRGWGAERERLFDRFFDGYTRGLSDPAYLPPDPAVVTRLRAGSRRTREQFLAWGESLMEMPTPLEADNAARSAALLETFVRALHPEVPAGYFGLKRVGWLHMGVGSALARKVLARVEGPSPSPGDDVLLEAKELSRLEGVPCLQEQSSEARDLWVRSWDDTYAEVTIADLASADELAEVVHDAGAQLGATNLRESIPVLEAQLRLTEVAAVRRLEPRIRATARQITDDALAGWEELRASK